MLKSITKRFFLALSLLAVCFTTSVYSEESGHPKQEMNKEEIRKIIKEYLMEQPEIIREAIQELEKRTAEAEKQRQKKLLSENQDLLVNEKYSFNAGNKDGDVTVVEFFDYNCPYCRQALKDIVKLMDEDKNVRVVLKEYPILGEASQKAALAALASRKQGKYMEFHQALLTAKGRINDKAIDTIAEKVGLDVKQLKKDMESADVKDALQKNIEVGIKLGINGTPTFIFNDQVIPQVLPYDAMKELLTKMRKAS